MELLKTFEDIDRTMCPRVGGKGASLGELVRAGFIIPPGFVVTTDAFVQYYQKGFPV